MIIDTELTKQIPAKQMATLLKVSASLASSLDLSIVLQTAIDSAVDVLGVDTGAIYLLEGDVLFLGATTPPLTADLEWLRAKPEALEDHPGLKRSFQFHKPVYITDAAHAELSEAEQAIRDARHLRTILFIPLLFEDSPVGALIVGTTGTTRAFTGDEIDLCRVLAYQITLAVTNAKLYKSIRKSHEEVTSAYDATLMGWSFALEMRDQETRGHTQRVAQNTELLSRALGIAEAELIHVRRGALLHDIGKMSIPDHILKKPGPLTKEEWAVMRMHPVYAYDFLVHIDYLKPALDIPYCHHEKWDGSGYPRGLAGDDIPLAARIFAVIDVFDALTSDRPYRPAWSREQALAYIEAQSGIHFDPSVVTAFFRGQTGHS